MRFVVALCVAGALVAGWFILEQSPAPPEAPADAAVTPAPLHTLVLIAGAATPVPSALRASLARAAAAPEVALRELDPIKDADEVRKLGGALVLPTVLILGADGGIRGRFRGASVNASAQLSKSLAALRPSR
jgi:hypothetical protein